MKIKTFKYVKEEGHEIDIFIPQQQSFFFETGIRRSICITPEWTTWKSSEGKEEEIWKLDVICVYNSSQNMVEIFSIQLSEIESLYSVSSHSSAKSIVTFLSYTVEYKRTKEQFLEDYNKVLLKINKIIE